MSNICTIEFHTSAPLRSLIPEPYPASQHAPEWLKEMPRDFEQGSTAKRCPPFLAAMTAGYIIPAPANAKLVMDAEGVLTARQKVGDLFAMNFISTHFPAQVQGAPFAGSRIVKFENPWVIVTPPDYVCLVTAPINRFEMPFMPFTGIVETGTYYREVHLPMACTMQPGQVFELPRGAPMIQVIPVCREEWSSRCGTLDPARRAEQEAMFKADGHFYKERFWQNMTFA
jgi:hypothetical protein